MFLTFWDSFLARFCEGNEQFVFIPRPSLPHEDYVAVGRIITQFVLTGTFLVQVAEAQMIQTIFGQVSEDCLVSSFLQLLRERERQIRPPNTLQSAREGWSVFHRRNSRQCHIYSDSQQPPSNYQASVQIGNDSQALHSPREDQTRNGKLLDRHHKRRNGGDLLSNNTQCCKC